MKTESKPSLRTDDHAASDMSEKEIDANLEQTFPASDPPSWTLGTDHNVSVNEEDEKDPESTNEN